MGNLGVPELLIILLVVLVFFGSKKIPELAQGLGKGIKEFRKATREVEDVVEKDLKRINEKPETAEKKG